MTDFSLEAALRVLTTVVYALLPVLLGLAFAVVLLVALFVVFLFLDIRRMSEDAMELYIAENARFMPRFRSRLERLKKR